MVRFVSGGSSLRYPLIQFVVERMAPSSSAPLRSRLGTWFPNNLVVGTGRLFTTYDRRVAGDACIANTGARILFTCGDRLTVHLIRDTDLDALLTTWNVRSIEVAVSA